MGGRQRARCQGLLIPTLLSRCGLTDRVSPWGLLKEFIVDISLLSVLVLTQAFPRRLHSETTEETPFSGEELVITVCSGINTVES